LTGDSDVNKIVPLPKQKRSPTFDPNENHGRYAASDYTGCSFVQIRHENLKVGDPCPDCAEAKLHGKLCELLPRVVVRLQGSPLITGVRYEVEKMRCSLCGNLYVARLPEEIENRAKYDETCRSTIAIARYYSGMPFKRLERLQALQGVPLADATQWDEIRKLYETVLPVYQELEKNAAQGNLLSYDDTSNRILEAYADNKAVHTTSFISMLNDLPIHLFYTSQRHAGENFELMLENRTVAEPFFTMTDASSQNMPKQINENLLSRWILCFCLVHGRRKFHEIFDLFPQECEFVLDIISQVYQHEADCKKHKKSAQERLLYHQEKSAPLMEALRVWLNNQLLYHFVEDHSGLGNGIRYMLRHWNALTQFLRIAGAPIDNSLCEQAIKVAIRHRRNSLFYRTFKGAEVGDCLMSLIHTVARNKINIFDYLNTLQRFTELIRINPKAWLPWNYQETLAELTQVSKKEAA
jgi:transposase